MTPERWQQVKKLFESAMSLDPERRLGYVKAVSGDDDQLRREVESMLDAERNAGSFIEETVIAQRTLQDIIEDADPMTGRRVGSYRIERSLGRGGMGTVYLAASDDEAHRQTVAIKMISRGMDTAAVISRFRKEQRILAELDHSNIAQLFDGGTTEDGLPYFVMEYIQGLPIDVYAEERQLSTEERLRLFQQICAAVDSAHAKRIVHRDIKPSNILVTLDGQPKLLDFGIAKIVTPDNVQGEVSATLTGTGRPMTPDYASPEQVRGEPVTPATDVYALGMLLYELMTGQRPYSLQTYSPEEMVRVICTHEPAKPSTYRQLPNALDSIILKALRKEPLQRYQTAAELNADIQAFLERRPITASRGAFRYRTRRYFARHGKSVGIALCLVIAAAGTAAALRWRGLAMERGTNEKAPSASATAVRSRPSIAVLGFKNLSSRPDTGWLSTALTEMVSTELAAGGQLRTVPAENMSRARLELSVKDDEAIPKETFSQLYKNVGADFLVDGSYLIADENRQLRVDLRVSNAQREAVFAVSESGPESDLFSIVSKAGSRLREQLGLSETAPNEVTKARAAFSQKPEAIRLYTEGLAKLRVFDAISALPLFEKAAELDSSQPLTYSAIAAAWAKLGYDAKAADSAKKAYELSTNLTREERLSIEGRYRESQKDWTKAIDIYKTLWGFFSDDVEYGLRLSAAQIAGGKGSDALTTIVAMRQLPAPASYDPRVDIAEGDALGSLSEFKRQQQVYAQAEKKVRSSRARLLLGATRLAEGRAFYNLGQPENAISALEEAKSVFAEAGDKAGIASALSSLAVVYDDQTDIPHEIQMYEQSLAITREIGDKRLTSSSLNNLGILFKDQGRYDDALKLDEEALALRREIGDKSWTAVSLNNIGVVFFEQDRFAEAQKNYMESLQICREIGDRRGFVRALHNLSVVKRELGELAEARKGYAESLEIRQEIGDKRGGVMGRVELAMVLLEMGELASAKRTIEEALPLARDTKLRPGEAQAFYLLGEIALAEDDLPAARKHHEAALQIRKELREDRTILESRLALVNIALEEGHALDAEAAITDLQKNFSGASPAPAQTMADLLLVQALLGQNKTSAAVVAMTSAQKMAVTAQRQDERAMNIITDARLYSARKQPEVALQKLNSLLAGLNQKGAIKLQFETRLAQCEARLRSSPLSDAQECAVSLAKDSESRGFKRMARKATVLLRER